MTVLLVFGLRELRSCMRGDQASSDSVEAAPEANSKDIVTKSSWLGRRNSATLRVFTQVPARGIAKDRFGKNPAKMPVKAVDMDTVDVIAVQESSADAHHDARSVATSRATRKSHQRAASLDLTGDTNVAVLDDCEDPVWMDRHNFMRAPVEISSLREELQLSDVEDMLHKFDELNEAGQLSRHNSRRLSEDMMGAGSFRSNMSAVDLDSMSRMSRVTSGSSMRSRGPEYLETGALRQESGPTPEYLETDLAETHGSKRPSLTFDVATSSSQAARNGDASELYAPVSSGRGVVVSTIAEVETPPDDVLLNTPANGGVLMEDLQHVEATEEVLETDEEMYPNSVASTR